MYNKTLGVDYGSGSQGADVMKIQQALQLAGFSPGPIDGVFGPRTKTAVQSFQSAHGLAIDGIVGPNTWSKLLKGAPAPGAQPATITVTPSVAVQQTIIPTAPKLLGGSIFGKLGNIGPLVGIALLSFLAKDLVFGKRKRRRK